MPRKKSSKMPMPPLAAYLQEELIARNMTLLEIESATGIPDSTLSPIFSGKVADPKASQLAKIARAMGIPWHRVWAIVSGEDTSPVNVDEEMQRIAVIVADHPELFKVMGGLTALGPRDLRAVRKYIELLRGSDD